jgi:hypothetical protein
MSFIQYPELCLLILAGSAVNACSSPDSLPDEQPYVADLSPDEEIVCRRYREVGTHIPVRVCRTRAEIRAAQEEAMRAVGPLRSMGGGGAGVSGDDPGPPR